jgi:hypothetical protein
MSIECSPTAGGLFPYATVLTTPALVLLLGYGIGIPIGIALGYRLLLDRLGMPELTKLIFMFLCGGYKDHLYFWQSLIMLRKLFLVMAGLFIQNDDLLLNYVAVWVMTAFLLLQLWVQPALQDLHNFIETVSLSVITVTLNLGLLYFWPGLSEFGKTLLTLVLLVATFFSFVVFLRFLAVAGLREFLPKVLLQLENVRGMVLRIIDRMMHPELYARTRKTWKRNVAAPVLMDSEERGGLFDLKFSDSDDEGSGDDDTTRSAAHSSQARTPRRSRSVSIALHMRRREARHKVRQTIAADSNFEELSGADDDDNNTTTAASTSAGDDPFAQVVVDSCELSSSGASTASSYFPEMDAGSMYRNAADLPSTRRIGGIGGGAPVSAGWPSSFPQRTQPPPAQMRREVSLSSVDDLL